MIILSNLLTKGILGYRVMEKITSDPFLQGFGTVLMILPGFALDNYSSAKSLGNIFDAFYNSMAKKTKTGYYLNENYPISSNTIFSLLLAFNFLSAYCYGTAVYEVVEASNLRFISEILSSFLMISATMTDYVYGTLALYNTLEKLASVPQSHRSIISDLDKLKTALSKDKFSLPEKFEDTSGT
jgi:hypothetical protein